MNIYDTILSKNYYCMYNLEELINYNEWKCIIDINFKRHKTDECFNQFALLFKSPKNNGNYLELGITEDGFVYLGETYLSKGENVFEIEVISDSKTNYSPFLQRSVGANIAGLLAVTK